MPYRPGDNLVICDQCGFKKYASECRMQHDNLFVCADCFDEKHPLLKPLVGLHEKQRAKIRRPEGEDVFLSPGDVTPDDL
jgi:hypothetical protein